MEWASVERLVDYQTKRKEQALPLKQFAKKAITPILLIGIHLRNVLLSKDGATRMHKGAGAPSEFQLPSPSWHLIFRYFDKLSALLDNHYAIMAFCKQLCNIFSSSALWKLLLLCPQSMQERVAAWEFCRVMHWQKITKLQDYPCRHLRTFWPPNIYCLAPSLLLNKQGQNRERLQLKDIIESTLICCGFLSSSNSFM